MKIEYEGNNPFAGRSMWQSNWSQGMSIRCFNIQFNNNNNVLLSIMLLL